MGDGMQGTVIPTIILHSGHGDRCFFVPISPDGGKSGVLALREIDGVESPMRYWYST